MLNSGMQIITLHPENSDRVAILFSDKNSYQTNSDSKVQTTLIELINSNSKPKISSHLKAGSGNSSLLLHLFNRIFLLNNCLVI